MKNERNEYLFNQYRRALFGPTWGEVLADLIGFVLRWSIIGACCYGGVKCSQTLLDSTQKSQPLESKVGREVTGD